VGVVTAHAQSTVMTSEILSSTSWSSFHGVLRLLGTTAVVVSRGVASQLPVSVRACLLYEPNQLKPSTDLEEFHDWYNTEHGPLRVKLDFVLHGRRYKSQHLDPLV